MYTKGVSIVLQALSIMGRVNGIKIKSLNDDSSLQIIIIVLTSDQSKKALSNNIMKVKISL